MNDSRKTTIQNNLAPSEEMNAGSMEQWRVFLFRAFFVLLDIVLLILALAASYALRFNFVIPNNHLTLMAIVFPFVVFSELVAMTWFGCFRLLWRTFSMVDLPRFLGAIGASLILMLLCRFLFMNVEVRFFPPISIAFMNSVFSVALLTGARWVVRMLAETGGCGKEERIHTEKLRRVVIAGSGGARSAIVYALRRGAGSSRIVVGFLDNTPEALGTIIHGIPVLGRISDAERVLRGRAIDEVIVVPGTLVREGMQSLFAAVGAIGAKLLIAPGYSTVLDGVTTGRKLRDAEITDLLRRRAMPLEVLATHRSCLTGRSVMVTGAGGSIGSEIARQAMRAGASVLILVERSEYALFMIHRELEEKQGTGTIVRRYVADIGNGAYMRQLLAKEKPEIVFHAAAYKHVPMMEENVCEAIRNNVFGTQSFAENCVEAGVKEFVLLSSDKAVAPKSVMGATKRMCEILVNRLNALGKTAFMAVRFGNVLGSTGSVVPIFREQIERGGPVTITHPEMTRYFMTIPEAVSLTIEAVATGDKGRGCVYVLDMGEPIRIVELAEEMIKLAGKVPGEEIPITFVGIRPGEKLHEQLTLENEKISPTENPQIGVGRLSKADDIVLQKILEQLQQEVSRGGESGARKLLMEFCLEKTWSGKENVA